MILTDVRRYLQQRGQATLGDIASHVRSEPSAVKGMLEHWVRKGKVHREHATSACGSGCTRCEPASVEIYRWLGGREDKGREEPVAHPPSCDRQA
jgi:hypothetical protein